MNANSGSLINYLNLTCCAETPVSPYLWIVVVLLVVWMDTVCFVVFPGSHQPLHK